MSPASTTLTGHDYFLGNSSVIQLGGGQRVALKAEGIVDVKDLGEFEDDDIDNVIMNLRQPQDICHPTVPVHTRSAEVAANPNVVLPVLFQTAVLQHDRVDTWTKKQAPLVCSALSVKRLKLASDIVHYHTSVGSSLTQENMKYVILKDYNDHLGLVKTLKKDQEIKIMKCRKDTVPLRWFEAALTFWNAYIGTRNCPLAYAVQEEALPNPAGPPLLVDKCYLIQHNSIKGEQVVYLSHSHSLFKDDNAKVLELLKESLRGSSIDSTIQPYKCRKDGRKAWTNC